MKPRPSVFALVIALIAFAAIEARAQSYGSYPAGYPFGSNGTPEHPNGYDGWPGDTPSGSAGRMVPRVPAAVPETTA